MIDFKLKKYFIQKNIPVAHRKIHIKTVENLTAFLLFKHDGGKNMNI